MTVAAASAPADPAAAPVDLDAFLSGALTAQSLVARLVDAATSATGGELTPAAAAALAAEFDG